MVAEQRRAVPWGLVAGAITVGGAAVVSTVASAFLAHLLVTPARRKRDDVDILAIDESTITLRRTQDTELPGRYALFVGRKIVKLGAIVQETATTVTRRLGGKARLRLGGRTTARFSGYHLHRPKDLGFDSERIEVQTELGPAPAWIIGESDSPTWCIQVHGRGVTRRETIRAVPSFVGRGIPCIAISYRNDGEAPRTHDGRYRLGLDEWRDVDSAIDEAVARGAKRVVVMGWSMGGAITMQLARRSRHRRIIAGIVLESPVVKWEPTLHLQTSLYRLPGGLVHAALSMLESRAVRLVGAEELDFLALDSVAHADSYTTPILLMHSRDDGYVPPDASRAFAAARPDIVTYSEWTGARHTKLWNWDESRFDREIGDWLEEHRFA